MPLEERPSSFEIAELHLIGPQSRVGDRCQVGHDLQVAARKEPSLPGRHHMPLIGGTRQSGQPKRNHMSPLTHNTYTRSK